MAADNPLDRRVKLKIHLMPRVEDIDGGLIKGSNVIVIDMLRATSVITAALKNGGKEVIPVLTTEEAFSIKQKQDNVVLGGERKGLKIEGFDGGNSPLEYTPELIKEKTLVFTTSNGTRAIKGCMGACHIYIGSMLNGRAAAAAASMEDVDVSIVCSGTMSKFSLDDFICAGYIIDELLKVKEYGLDDISFLAHHTFIENKGDIEKFISHASHYDYLVNIGAGDDIKYCCLMDIIDVVPEYLDGKIII
jgi:2-phosphosulfolactate phosphatase